MIINSRSDKILIVYWLDHPSQLDVPLFRYLTSDSGVDLLVIYCSSPGRDLLPEDKEIERKPIWDFGLFEGYSYITIGSSFIDGLRSVIKYSNKNNNFFGIMAGTNKPAFLGVIVGSLICKADIMVRYDSTLNYITGTPSIRQKLKKYLLPLFLSQITYLGYTGKWARAYLENYGATERQLFWFPYTIDNQMFEDAIRQAGPLKEKLRNEMMININAMVFLVIAKFNVREAPMDAIKAFNLMNDPNTSLIVVGDGPQMSEIRELVAENVNENIHLVGYVSYSNLPKYYASADVFIHPAHNECWGASVNEAMVCELPVIAADMVGAAADLVSHGVNGYIYPHGDINSLCGFMKQCVTNRTNLPVMGRHSKNMMDAWGAMTTSQRLINFIIECTGA